MILAMQRELAQAVRFVYGLLAQTFGRDLSIDLGGGSTLAARYDHRLSTDLDIWRRESVTQADRAWDAMEPHVIGDALAHEAWIGAKPTVSLYGTVSGFLRPEVVEADLPKGEEGIEVVAGRDLTFQRGLGRRQQVYIAGTRLRPQNDEEILWGKLIRMKDKAVTERDLYDFAVLSHCAPERVGYALDKFGENDLKGIVRMLRHRAIDRRKKRILQPRWKVADPETVRKALVETLESELEAPRETQGSGGSARRNLEALQATCTGRMEGGSRQGRQDEGRSR